MFLFFFLKIIKTINPKGGTNYNESMCSSVIFSLCGLLSFSLRTMAGTVSCLSNETHCFLLEGSHHLFHIKSSSTLTSKLYETNFLNNISSSFLIGDSLPIGWSGQTSYSTHFGVFKIFLVSS